MLFSDAGFDGLVIKIAFTEIEINGEEMVAGAGAPDAGAGAEAPASAFAAAHAASTARSKAFS